MHRGVGFLPAIKSGTAELISFVSIFEAKLFLYNNISYKNIIGGKETYEKIY